MPAQNNWWWCNKCQGLTFAGGLVPGMCQAGGQHDHGGSGEYTLVHDEAAAPGQNNWRWCSKCQGLTFAGNPSLGACPVGGQHDHTGSGNYSVVQNSATAPGQPNWRWCTKCQGLTFAGNPSLGPCPAGGQHDHTGSGNYVVALNDRKEPIDQPISRHLLTEFGPCNTLAQAYTTLDLACKAMAAKGGGVIVIPNSLVNLPDFVARNAVQDPTSKAGVLIEDYRGGALRLVVLPEGIADIYGNASGGIIVERDVFNDIPGQGGGSALAISNNSRGGVNSISDTIQKDVAAGNDARFYVKSLRGLCPGNWFNISNASAQLTTTQIKTLAMDGDDPYFTADTTYAYQKDDRYWHKNWFSALEIADTHNSDDQSGTVSITRQAFGSGDTFGVQTSLFYSSDIMSAGGDEGGVAYSAEVTHDVEVFSGVVESWDSATNILVFKWAGAVNTWKLGTSRPIINMNASKWITSGSVIIPQNGYDYNGISGTVIGTPDVVWDSSIVGQFITINDPSEYYTSSEVAHYTGATTSPFVRRWFRISGLSKRADGLFNLAIETVWWGSYTGGKPVLLNSSNYTTVGAKKLSYIIAPGSWAADVRHALGPRRYYAGADPADRTIVLAPFQNSKAAFAPGDPIEQPAGPTPWTPTAYRTRNVHFFPPLMAGSCFEAVNRGPTHMASGLAVEDGQFGRTMAEVLAQQKDAMPSFATGVAIGASTVYGIHIGGPVLYDAVHFAQADGNTKTIRWFGIGGHQAALYATPDTGNLIIEPTGDVHLSQKSTIYHGGLSATDKAAKNLRGINVAVPANASSIAIGFAAPESDAQYAIIAECGWLTVTAIQNKSSTGFTVMFATNSPATGGALDWFLVR